MIPVDSFVDKTLGHKQMWEIHVTTLREVFARLREANLIENQLNIRWDEQTLIALSENIVQPNANKIDDIKMQVLGLGFCVKHKFWLTLQCPLTNLTIAEQTPRDI